MVANINSVSTVSHKAISQAITALQACLCRFQRARPHYLSKSRSVSRMLAIVSRSRVYPRMRGGTGGESPTWDGGWVYPCACGGTESLEGIDEAFGGLSPRVRGNQARVVHDVAETRSIPARAGEPPGRRGRRAPSRAYPRACGEPLRKRARKSSWQVYPRACGGTRRIEMGLS